MIRPKDGQSGPIEVWLTRRSNRIGVDCKVVREDETATEYDVDSPSMRGAQRETTSWLIKEGYAPIGRWETTAEENSEATESVRRFKPA